MHIYIFTMCLAACETSTTAQATKPEVVEEKKIEIAPKAAALEVEVKEKTKASL